MNVPIFRLEFEKEFIDKYKKNSEEILASGRPIGEGKFVKLFEDSFKNLVGAKYAMALTSGTAALEIALKVLDVKEKIVIIPANTFFATTIAVTNAGGEIYLVDVEEENFSIDPNELEKAIVRNRNNVGAVVIVHVGGIISKNILEIKKICEKYKILLVEDAAQAHLSKYKNLSAGTIGDIGCFSFFPTKAMTAGEAGILTTNKKKYYEMAKSLKNFGRDNNNIEICINSYGNNYKISEFTGLLGYLEGQRVEKRVSLRNKYKDIYIKKLKGSNYVPLAQEHGSSSCYKMILKTNIDREWLRNYCKKKNITLTGEVWKTPIHKQPLYEKVFAEKKFPTTDKISKTHICPPLYPELSVKEVNYICDVLLRAEKDYEKQNS